MTPSTLDNTAWQRVNTAQQERYCAALHSNSVHFSLFPSSCKRSTNMTDNGSNALKQSLNSVHQAISSYFVSSSRGVEMQYFSVHNVVSHGSLGSERSVSRTMDTIQYQAVVRLKRFWARRINSVYFDTTQSSGLISRLELPLVDHHSEDLGFTDDSACSDQGMGTRWQGNPFE